MSSIPSICSYLGCAEDRLSVCGYPSRANSCYAGARSCKAGKSLNLEQQERFCLAIYQECPRYRPAQ